MRPTFQRVALAAVLGIGLVVPAAAQDRGPGPAGARGGDRQKLFEERQHAREQRLHDLLQIKPDQEAAFGAFVSSLEQLRPPRRPRQGDAGQSPSDERALLTTPERLDRSLQRLQKQAAAVKTFYAALSPEQRKVFDEFGSRGLGGGRGFARRPRRGRFGKPPFR